MSQHVGLHSARNIELFPVCLLMCVCVLVCKTLGVGVCVYASWWLLMGTPYNSCHVRAVC